MAARSEDDLFLAFRRDGDTAALADLFDATAKELLRVAVHLCGELSDAEDLVQDTYLAAIESAARWRPRQPVRAWLIGILHNRARRLFRDRRRKRKRPEAPAAEPSAADTAARRDLRDTVRSAIATLAEPYRTVVGLHARHGMTVAEIATALQRSPHTVRSQLARGLDRVEPRLPDRPLAAAPALLAMRQVVVEHAQAVGGASLPAAAGVSLRWSAAVVLFAAPLAWWLGTPGVDATPVELARNQRVAVARGEPSPATRELAPLPREGASPRPIADPVRYRVLDRRTGEPVPGATVRTFGVGPFRQYDMPPSEFDVYSFLWANDIEELLRRYGTSTTTGADGTFVLDGLQGMLIAARKDGLYGQVFDPEESILFVEPDRPLTVEVVDAAGVPVGGTEVRVFADRLSLNARGRRCSTLGRTDRRGIATIQHIQRVARIAEVEGVDEVWIAAVMPCRGPGLEAARRSVPTRELGAGVVRLRLPATGVMRVRVRDHAGRLLAPPPDRRDGLSVSLGRFALRPAGQEWIADHVPVGGELQLAVAIHGSVHMQVVTLDRAGEERVVDVDLGADGITLAGRAVDGEGRPLADRDLLAGTVVVRTDAEGRFWVRQNAEDAAATLRLQVVTIARDPVGWERCRVPRNASATVRGPTGGRGVFQLGDVRFVAAPLLAQGRVDVAPAGVLEELRGHRVRVVERHGDRWTDVPGAAVEWTDEGRFSVFGHAAGERLRLVFTSVLRGRALQDLGIAPLELRRGDRDVRFARRLAGDIAVDIRTSAVEPSLVYEVTSAAGGAPLATELYPIRRPASHGVDGAHLLHVVAPVPAGTWRVQISDRSGVVLRVLDRIDVRSGVRSRPLLAAPLDLR